MSERRQVNFTIVPAEAGGEPRTYANFCAVSHTPFDFTLTFCEVQPLTEHDVKQAEAGQGQAGRPRAVHSKSDFSAAGALARLQRIAAIARRVEGRSRALTPVG